MEDDTPTVRAAPHFPTNLDEDGAAIGARKENLRRRACAVRDALPPLGAEALAEHLAAWLATMKMPPPAIVGGYWPIGSEIDPRPALACLGCAVALPETTPRGTALRFRMWAPDAPLRAGRFGTFHPEGAEVVPDLVLVPLLAFDRRCHRLGYGGGYYDRTLAAWPGVVAIGCAYAAQEVDEVPALPHDVRLDAIATERGVVIAEG